ncbi:serine hydrolase [Acuticoccus sediminis]|uniref:serine hydrolase n=1 Tax=Acuticoccus sediminis TaxID=2184697 RepID=UPI001CFEBD03|nr:serine hydrolase [Acuticoccus sediminis]
MGDFEPTPPRRRGPGRTGRWPVATIGGAVAWTLAAALTPPHAGAQQTAPEGSSERTLLPAPVVPVAPSLTREDVDDAVGLLDNTVTGLMDLTGIPGVAVAVVYKDEVIYEKTFGVREVGKPDPIDTDTVFLLASVSKPIASTVVAGLAGKELFALSDPVSQYNPAFALGDPYVTEHATFIDLLSHRSGLFTGAGDFLEDLGFDRDTILGRIEQQPLDTFRSSYHYSNFGYTAGGEAAAVAAGKPFEDVAEEVLFDPLGMTRTSYRHADYLAHENRAHIHVRTGPEATTWAARYDRNPDAEAPAGGASSTITDMAKFVRLQLAEGEFGGEPVIARAPLAITHRPHSVTGGNPGSAARAHFYGLGWNVSYDDEGRVELSHSGAFTLGTSTNVTMLPGEDLGIVVLTNGEPIGVPETIATIFMDVVRNGEQTVDWYPLFHRAFAAMAEADIADARAADPTGDPGEALPLEAYAGTYDNSYFGPARVTLDGDALTMALGPDEAPVSFALTRDVGGRFVFETIGEWGTGPSRALFEIGADGTPSRLTLGAYNTRGLGVFERP